MLDITSYLFVILVPLFFLGFIVAIVYTVIKNAKAKKGLTKFAEKMGWEHIKTFSKSEEAPELNKYLEASLYNIHKGRKITVSDVIKGNYNNMGFHFAYYKAVSENYSTNRSLTFSSEWNIFVVATEKIEKELIMINRKGLYKHIPIEKLSELVGKPLTVPNNEGIDWMYVSNEELLKSLNLDLNQYKILRDAMSNAHSLLFFKGFFIYAIQASAVLSPGKIKAHLVKVKQVKDLLG